MSFQHIVMETKLKIEEGYIQYRSHTISEIAGRLHLTDSIGFTGLFKNFRGKKPKVFLDTVKA